MTTLLWDTAILFFLGTCGWMLFSALRLPIAPFLGATAFIGALRILEVPVPSSPAFINTLIQIVLGLYVGSKITRDTARELKTLALPALLIVTWALGIVFILGTFLARISFLDPYTAFLASSMGGLPEMTVIALATGANLPVIITMQAIRMLTTVALFPLILRYWLRREDGLPKVKAEEASTKETRALRPRVQEMAARWKEDVTSSLRDSRRIAESLFWGVISLGVASAGGLLLLRLGVPAGAMVGSMLSALAASLAGLNVRGPSPKVFAFMLVGVGIMISGNISRDTLEALSTLGLIIPIVVSTVIIFFSSLAVAYLIHRFMGWDLPTCFLAAAPAGFTVMTALAIKSGKDPFRVSILHLCRLIALKSVVPFVFMMMR